jgi:hypothetical protein
MRPFVPGVFFREEQEGGVDDTSSHTFDTQIRIHAHVLPLTEVFFQIRWGMMMAAAALAIAGCVLAAGNMGDSVGEVTLFDAAKRKLTPEEKKFVKQVPTLARSLHRHARCCLPCTHPIPWRRRAGIVHMKKEGGQLPHSHPPTLPPSLALLPLIFLPDENDVLATNRQLVRRIRTWSRMASLRQRRGRTT